MRFRSVDGTLYGIVGSPADYVLNPAFLRFIFAAIILYRLLDQNQELSRLTGWLIWGQVIVVILLWLVIGGSMVQLLLRRGLIRQVWTPVLLLPMLFLLEAMVQVTYHFSGLPPKPLSRTVFDLTRVMAVILVFDFLHGQYVVARHPLARILNAFPVIANATPGVPPYAPPPDNGANMPDPAQMHDTAVAGNSNPPALGGLAGAGTPRVARPGPVRIGSESFVLSDILMIRIEDHYLSIITRSGNTLQRAKLAAIKELHNGDVGIQINRSVWVAFWAIREVQATKAGQILLILDNGDDELVAKPRLHAFRQAYRIATGEAA